MVEGRGEIEHLCDDGTARTISAHRPDNQGRRNNIFRAVS